MLCLLWGMIKAFLVVFDDCSTGNSSHLVLQALPKASLENTIIILIQGKFFYLNNYIRQARWLCDRRH